MAARFHIRKFLITFIGTFIWALASQAGVPDADSRRDAVVRAVEEVIPCVVNISSEAIVESADPFDQLFREFFDPYFRRRPPDAQKSLGSGVIIDETGYLLTNSHVVRRGTRIVITLTDGREREARLLNANMRSDVALLQIVPKGDETFKAIRFAMDDDLLLGETVIALGNPFGLGISVSRGILSSRTRRPPVENVPLDLDDWLQIDAAINPGNSGGPLVNVRGELIGLNVAVLREGQGIGFAIPIKRVSEALSEIFSPEGLRSLWFGARFQAGTNGIVTASVQTDSPAKSAGLREGDRVLRVNGKTPNSVIELYRDVIGAERQPMELTIQRGAERKTLSIRMIPEKEFFTPELIREKLGITLQSFDETSAREFGLGLASGLVIASVEKDSPADRVALKRGYVIQAIDGQVPRDLVQAAKLLYAKKRGEKVRLALVMPKGRGRIVQLYQGAAEVAVR